MPVTLYIGPMFSSKTTTLIGQYAEGDTIAYKFSADKRYSADAIVSHDGLSIPATSCDLLPVLEDKVRDRYGMPLFETVLIDESQFFENLREAVGSYVKLGLKVYITALSGTSELTPWQRVSEILPICDDIVHLKAKLCMRCHRHQAPFTAVKKDAQKIGLVDIGGADKYEPVCGRCHPMH
jgi:thymidine kinase